MGGAMLYDMNANQPTKGDAHMNAAITTTEREVLQRGDAQGERIGKIVTVAVDGKPVEQHSFWYTYTPTGAVFHHISTLKL